MSIGLNVTFRDPPREDYWPYLTQRHLRDCLWPVARALGCERVDLLEVVCSYRSAQELEELVSQLELVAQHVSQPAAGVERYTEWAHVLTRTNELVQRLRKVLTEWDDVCEVAFF